MNLIELINSVVNSLSTREIAIIIMVIVFLIIIFSIKKTRNAVFDLLKIFFSAKKIIIPFIGMTLYISLILYLLSSIELFTNSLIKNAIFWFIVGALPLFYKAAYIKEKYKNFFRKNAIECFALSAIFSFLINFYTFNVIIELILISITIFIVLTLAVSKTNEKYKLAEKFFSTILVIIFVCLILNFTYNLFINPNGFLNINTVITFILPAILTFFLLPYIYVLALYIAYDTFYLRLRVVINDSKTYKYVPGCLFYVKFSKL